MKVLDIGCGSGVMSCWIAQHIGHKGRILGIENNANQFEEKGFFFVVLRYLMAKITDEY